MGNGILPKSPSQEHRAGDDKRRRRLLLVLWLAAAMLLGCLGIFVMSPRWLYDSWVDRIATYGVDPQLARWLGALPALVFLYSIGSGIKAFVFGRRKRALAAVVILALLGLADNRLAQPKADELFNPITTESNYRWYRSEATPEEPAGEIVRVDKWWKVSGTGEPVHEFTTAIAQEYERQQQRKHANQVMVTDSRKLVADESSRFQTRATQTKSPANRVSVVAASVTTTSEIGMETVHPERAATPPQPKEISLVGQQHDVPAGDGRYVAILRSYKRSGSSLYLSVGYVNQTSGDLKLSLFNRNCVLFDDSGSQYTASSANFGGNQSETVIPPGATINALLRYDGLSMDAATARVLRISTDWRQPDRRVSTKSGTVSHAFGFPESTTAEFRDFPISSVQR